MNASTGPTFVIQTSEFERPQKLTVEMKNLFGTRSPLAYRRYYAFTATLIQQPPGGMSIPEFQVICQGAGLSCEFGSSVTLPRR
jgi:hypothetical protein